MVQRGLAILLICWLFTPSNADACRCRRLTPSQAYRQAKRVFLARTAASLDKGAPSRIEARVSTVWKGDVARRIVHLEGSSKASGSCAVPVTPNTTYLVFSSDTSNPVALHKCSMTQAIVTAGSYLDYLDIGKEKILAEYPARKKFHRVLQLFKGDFQRIDQLKNIPPTIRAYLAKRTTIGEAFHPWNATDAIRKGLPRRRFVVGGKRGKIYFILYERGGRGYQQHLAVFRHANGKVELKVVGVLLARVHCIESLRKLIPTDLFTTEVGGVDQHSRW